ncbi:MAG: tetratricopeptide repeat protein [Bacteroidota bacterium]
MYYTQEAARSIPLLESRLAANRYSPVFARLAWYYLQEGRAEKAMDLCLEGLRTFPRYATARLVLGKAYEAQGRHVEALLEYRKAQAAFPDNPAVADLLARTERREQEAFRAFAEERARKLKERRGTMTMEQYAAQDAAAPGTVDFLLERLRTGSVPPAGDVPPSEPPPAPRIVTATLAEIYASQGQYAEAVRAYRRLLEEHPGDADRFEKRIAELEEKRKVPHAEQKT